MNQLRAETKFVFAWHRSHRVLTAITAICFAVGFLASGCASEEAKNTSTTTPGKGQPATAGGATKPTPEQEAAKAHGEEIGPAIAAANAEGQGK